MSHQDEKIHYMSYGTSPKTLSSYITGLALCVILTLIAFGLVSERWLSVENTYIGLALLAVVQLFVQVICFLRLNVNEEGRWTSMSFLFSIFVVIILVFGTLWIMYNLNYNMMN